MDKFAEVFALFMGVTGAVGGAIAWYGASVKKSYASERDFGHLKNSYDNLANNVGQLDRMLDQRFDAIQRENVEMKTLLQGILLRMGGNSQIFNREDN